MNRLDVNYINIFSDYTVWAEGENLYFVTDYNIKYLDMIFCMEWSSRQDQKTPCLQQFAHPLLSL